tara:strand:+ start:4171 stop:6354 length:2184 start_codon:yes stop_codon:yes gene_type:complete
MRKLLKEHFKELLTEEIDYSSKIATVYHLTGFKTAQYDSVYAEKMKKTNKDLADRIESKYAGKEKTRAQSILSKVEYKAAAKELKQFKTPQGQAYYIANNVRKGAWDLGSYYFPGHGKMYAKGLYTCYKLNPAIAQTYGSVILRFDVDISSMLIFNAGIAKGIYGENFRLEDQFLEICKKKNVDIRGYYNQEVSLDISPDANDAISEFINMLRSISDRQEFLNSSYDTELRTAPFALQVIEEYSRQFKRGRYAILRDVIDGVIFWGRGDGPVCIVYNPEINLRHKLTGAGYFDKKGEPIIEDVIERLVGRSGTSLLDTFEFSQEIDEEAQEIEKARAEKFKQQLANFSREDDSTDDFINNLPSKLNTILTPVTNLYKDACDDLIISRVKDTQPDFDNYCRNVAEGYNYIQFICSILAEPFLQFVDIFGPGLDIVNKDEFEKYCYIFKQYSSDRLFNNYSLTPKLADFELNGLKCVAQNEEEFAKLVEQHLKPLANRFNEMLKEGLASEFVNEISYEAIGAGETGVFNNSITKFEIGEVSLNTTNDAQALESSLEGSGTIMQKAEQELLDLFNDERIKSPEGQAALEDVLQYNKTINTDGTLDFGEIVKNFGYYSGYCHAGGDIFYTLCEQIRSLDYAGLASYEIDRNIFDPEFILQRMYDQKEEWKVRDAAGLSLSMFKDGRKAYNDITLVTTEFVKQRVIHAKSGNLEWVVETVFDLPMHREKLII